jgi:glycerophosphoryl diester phosphodiesterase
MRTRRLIVIALSGLALIGAGQVWRYQHRDGCRAYVPASGPLVAHAGGGLPEQTYANNLEALDLAASHGFTMVELDFLVEKGRLVIGHDADHRSSLSPAGLMRWLDAHPRVSVVTDFKSDNLSGLALLRLLAGERAGRFIPQIYAPGEFAPVVAMGYPTPILTAYRLPDRGWQQAANALPLRAVTIAYKRRALAEGLRHPVFLHTVNRPVAGYGLYTDCLVPAA